MKWWAVIPLFVLIVPTSGWIEDEVQEGMIIDITYDPIGPTSEHHSIEILEVEEDLVNGKYYVDEYPNGSPREISVSLNIIGDWFVHIDFDKWTETLDSSPESLVFITSYGYNESLLNYSYFHQAGTDNFVLLVNYTQVTDGVIEYFEYNTLSYIKKYGVRSTWFRTVVDGQTGFEATERWVITDSYFVSDFQESPFYVPPVLIGLLLLRLRQKR